MLLEKIPCKLYMRTINESYWFKKCVKFFKTEPVSHDKRCIRYKITHKYKVTFEQDELDAILELLTKDKSNNYFFLNDLYETDSSHTRDHMFYPDKLKEVCNKFKDFIFIEDSLFIFYNYEFQKNNTFEAIKINECEQIIKPSKNEIRKQKKNALKESNQKIISQVLLPNINAVLDKYGMIVKTYMSRKFISFKKHEDVYLFFKKYFEETVEKDLKEMGLEAHFNKRIRTINEFSPLIDLKDINIKESNENE